MNARLAAGIALATTLSIIGCTKPVKTTTCSGTTKATASGACVECLTKADCAPMTYCDENGTCASCMDNQSACTSSGTDAGMTGCALDSECATGQYCSAGACLPGCSKSSQCATGKVCTNNACVLGCDATSACVTGLQCCLAASSTTGVCTDTKTNAAKNCGGCGMPACATGDSCCGGTCADTQTDPNNCGTCKKSCGGSVKCVAGKCAELTGVFALYDAAGKVDLNGTKTAIEVLKPLAYVQTGSGGTASPQDLLGCKGFYYSGTTGPAASGNAGVVKMTGYAGGTLADTTVAPSEVDCVLTNGNYQCGYGAPTGTPAVAGPASGQASFVASTDVLGANPMLTFSAPGGGTMDDFGMFNVTVAAASSFPLQEDLSSLTYDPSSAAGTTIHLNCGGAGGCGAGGLVLFIKATPNDSLHFEDPSANYGYIQCVGTYGMAFGQNLGPEQITVSQAAIKAMLNVGGTGGTDATLTTFVTTAATLTLTQAQALFGNNLPKDSLGHNVLAIGGKGWIGVSAKH